MCNYRESTRCIINNSICPWVYWCDKIQGYKESTKMPNKCHVAETYEIPNGYYKVEFERRGYLYVNVDGTTIKILNPFDNIPFVVRMYKTKSGEWKIKKTKEQKENEGT